MTKRSGFCIIQGCIVWRLELEREVALQDAERELRPASCRDPASDQPADGDGVHRRTGVLSAAARTTPIRGGRADRRPWALGKLEGCYGLVSEIPVCMSWRWHGGL